MGFGGWSDASSRFPELQQTVLAVGGDQVLVRVVGDADHVFLVDLQEEEGTKIRELFKPVLAHFLGETFIQ